jgi:hypothetical protein
VSAAVGMADLRFDFGVAFFRVAFFPADLAFRFFTIE